MTEHKFMDNFDMTTLWGCYELLDALRTKGVIQSDPHRKDNILVYVTALNHPGVWYSQNIFDAAEELLHDTRWQQRLLRELEANENERNFIQRTTQT